MYTYKHCMMTVNYMIILGRRVGRLSFMFVVAVVTISLVVYVSFVFICYLFHYCLKQALTPSPPFHPSPPHPPETDHVFSLRIKII